MSTALRCPFLSRIPVNQVKKTASQLMSYAERCPVMVHAMSYMNGPDMMTVTGNLKLGHLHGTYSYIPVQGLDWEICLLGEGLVGVFTLKILFFLPKTKIKSL